MNDLHSRATSSSSPRRRPIGVLRMAVGSAALLLATAPAVAADEVHLQTDWIPSGEHAMYFGGWTKGFWKSRHRYQTSPAATDRAIR